MNLKNSRTFKTALNTIAGLVNVACNTLLNFILRTIFINILGIQYAGVSSVFSGILNMLSLSELGIGIAITTALYKPLYNNDKEKIKKLMTFYKKAYRFIALFIFIVGIILLPFLKYLITDIPDIKENIYMIFILYIIKTSASYLLIYKTTIMNADQKQYIVKGIETICLFVRYIVEAIFLLVFRDFMTYLIIEILATIIQNIVVTNKATKIYSYAFEKTNEKLSKTELKGLFKDIKGLTMYRISGTIGNNIDTLLVSSFLGASSVGILGNYNLIREQLTKIILQFLHSTTASIGNLSAEKDNKKQLLVFNRLFYISFAIVNLCATCLFALSNDFIKLWLGDKYLLSSSISFVIAFDFFLYILLQVISPFRTANGLFIEGQYRPLITAVLNVILSVVFIKHLGIFGTILATIVSRLLTQWYDAYLLFKKVLNVSFGKFYIKYWHYIIIFFISSIISFFINKIFVLPNLILDFIVKGILCSIISMICLILNTYKTDEYRYCINFIEDKTKFILQKVRGKIK